jgi:hypothetical protein
MDKNDDLGNGVRVEMDEFDSVVIKESAEEVASREAKSALEEGREHNNLCRIGCRNIFPDGRMPLQNCAVWEKVIHNKLVDFTLIRDGRLKKVWMQGGHGWEEGSQQHEIGASTKEEITGN